MHKTMDDFVLGDKGKTNKHYYPNKPTDVLETWRHFPQASECLHWGLEHSLQLDLSLQVSLVGSKINGGSFMWGLSGINWAVKPVSHWINLRILLGMLARWNWRGSKWVKKERRERNRHRIISQRWDIEQHGKGITNFYTRICALGPLLAGSRHYRGHWASNLDQMHGKQVPYSWYHLSSAKESKFSHRNRTGQGRVQW